MIAPFHADSLQASTKAKLVAMADIRKDLADTAAAKYGCKSYGSLDGLLSDDEVQVVSVLLPNHLHKEPVVMAAEAGRHVLVEKPPSMSLSETDDMIQASRENNVKLAVVLQCRMRKPVQAMKKALAEGRYGQLYQADTVLKWWRTQEYYKSAGWRCLQRSGAGVTIQHAFHYIDLLQYLAGPAKRVWARMENIAHPAAELEDTLTALVEYESGARGLVQASTAFWPGQDLRIELCGEKGASTMVGERTTLWQFQDERPEDEEIRHYGSAAVQTGASSPTALSFKDHQMVIEDLADSIKEDREPLISAPSVRPTLEIALAMYLSARVQDWVELPLDSKINIWE